uniref:8.9 kDa family member n=1 Tax=Rhipicephalus zambeziensis TaxID=60191 RepID=A0A224YAB0_9ACAR
MILLATAFCLAFLTANHASETHRVQVEYDGQLRRPTYVDGDKCVLSKTVTLTQGQEKSFPEPCLQITCLANESRIIEEYCEVGPYTEKIEFGADSEKADFPYCCPMYNSRKRQH